MIAIFPEIAVAAEQRDIEKLAVLIRQYFCDEKATKPGVDVHRLIKVFGIPFSRMPMSECGVLAVRDDRGTISCSIAIQEGLQPVEETFLLAHLLGHFLLHIQPRIARTEWKSSGYREEESPMLRFAQHATALEPDSKWLQLEQECDRFAAALLMPAGMFKRAIEKLGPDYARIASIFEVTVPLVEARHDEFNVLQAVIRQVNDSDKEGATAKTPPKITVRPAAKSTAHSEKSAKESPVPQEDTLHMVREQHHQSAPTPRAIAKQSYSSTNPIDSADTSSKLVSGKGMDRIREIARMLDKSGR